MMQVFIDFAGNYILGNDFFRQCGIIFVILSVFRALGFVMKKRIHSAYLRDSMVVGIMLLLYTLYFIFVYQPFRSDTVKSYDNAQLAALVISVTVFTQLYFFFRHRLISERGSFRRNEIIRFIIITVLIFLQSNAHMQLRDILEGKGNIGLNNDIQGEISFTLRMIGLLHSLVFAALFACVNSIQNILSYQSRKRDEQKDVELAEIRNNLLQSQLDSLYQRINPHFLYNALNSIAALTYDDAGRSREMTIALSKLFRYYVNKDPQPLVTIGEEINVSSLYLDIERIRFGNRLNVIFEVDDSLKQEKIPPFLLQPLIENAIKHGLKCAESFEVKIRIEADADTIMLSVGDNGCPFEDDFLPGYGFKSIYDKLDLLYPGRYELSILRQPEKKVLIYLRK